MMELYKNIKARRKALGMTQAQLAGILGYSDKSAICHIESGSVNLSLTRIHEFAEALHTTASDLLGNDGVADQTIDGDLLEIVDLGRQMDAYHLKKYLEWGHKILESQKMIGD